MNSLKIREIEKLNYVTLLLLLKFLKYSSFFPEKNSKLLVHTLHILYSGFIKYNNTGLS